MANVPISGLPAAGALAGTELVPVVQSGVTAKTTTQDIANLSGGGSGLHCDVFTPTGSGYTYTLTHTPGGKVMLIWNGLTVTQANFSVVGTTLTTVSLIGSGDTLEAYY